MSGISLADLSPLMLDGLVLLAGLQVFLMDLALPHGRKRALGLLTVGLLFGILVASFFVDTDGTAFLGAYEGGAWPMFFKRVALVAGGLMALGSIDYVDRHFPDRQGEFYALMLFSLLGMTILPGARDLILLIVCFELMGIPLAMMASFAKSEDGRGAGRFAPEAGLKLYLISAASTAITLFGLSLVYGMAGDTKLDVIARATSSPLLTLGMFATLAGMGFKIGAVPFHLWVPDTYQGAPTPFVAFLSVAPKASGFAALALVFLSAFHGRVEQWAPIILALVVLSVVIGNLMALPQRDVKRLLAYSGIAQVGYMLMALLAADAYGTGMLLFYVAGYVVTNMGVFLVVVALESDSPHVELEAFDGLFARAPWLALALLMFLLSLAGIPFVVGFWAKLYVFMAVYQAGYVWLVLFGALAAIIALFYYLQVARAAYMNPPRTQDPLRVGWPLKSAIVLCLLAVVGMGAYPRPFVESARLAARAFFP